MLARLSPNSALATMDYKVVAVVIVVDYMDIVIAIIILDYKVIVIMDGQEDHKIKFQGVRPTAALEQTSEQDKWEKKVILLD